MTTTTAEHHPQQHGAWVSTAEIAALMKHSTALALLLFLRSSYGPDARFTIPDTLAASFGWRPQRLKRARRVLVEYYFIRRVKRGKLPIYQSC